MVYNAFLIERGYMDWYDQWIEPEIRGLVKYLRSNGIKEKLYHYQKELGLDIASLWLLEKMKSNKIPYNYIVKSNKSNFLKNLSMAFSIVESFDLNVEKVIAHPSKSNFLKSFTDKKLSSTIWNAKIYFSKDMPKNRIVISSDFNEKKSMIELI